MVTGDVAETGTVATGVVATGTVAGDTAAEPVGPTTRDLAWAVAAAVPDPELPMLTLADLGVLSGVDVDGGSGAVTAWLTPTYSGCPAVAEMAADVDRRLCLLYTPPRPTSAVGSAGPVPLILGPTRAEPGSHAGAAARPGAAPPVPCPQCGATETEELSRFGSTACKALWRCRACREPFERVKEI